MSYSNLKKKSEMRGVQKDDIYLKPNLNNKNKSTNG